MIILHSDDSVDFEDVDPVETSVKIPVFPNMKLGLQDSINRPSMLRDSILQRMEKVRAVKKLKKITATAVLAHTSDVHQEPASSDYITSTTNFTGMLPSNSSSDWPSAIHTLPNEAICQLYDCIRMKLYTPDYISPSEVDCTSYGELTSVSKIVTKCIITL